MDLHRDDVRRQLRDVERAHNAALPGWRDALLRMFAGDEHAPEPVRAQLVGAPDRRGFLRLGGVTVAAAAVFAACGKDDTKPAQTGITTATTAAAAGASSTTAAPPTTGEANPEDQKLDLSLLRTATSIELLAVRVYDTATPKIDTPAVRDAAQLFRDQHAEHADALQAATRESFGQGKVYKKPNEFLMKNAVAPALPGLRSDTSIAKFALELENIAASTYVFAASQLSTPTLRQTIMTIGSVEARHAAILSSVLKMTVPTDPFFTTRDAVTKDALV